MTQAQTDALIKAKEILAEHFSAVVFTFEHETPDETGDVYDVMWIGGWAKALGMTYYALHKIHESTREDESSSL